MAVVFRKKESELRGRSAKFQRTPARLLVSVAPDPVLAQQYVPLPTQDIAVQAVPSMSHHEVNTETIDFASTGMNHTEGGWPRDVSLTEDDQKTRYRKKVEKDDGYIHSMLQLGQKIEHCIRQNNAIDIYEMYFEDDETPTIEAPEPMKTVNVIRDPHGGRRMVTSLDFSPEGGHKIAAAYSSSKFMGLTSDIPKESYIWDINTSSHPELELIGPAWLQCLQYNSKDNSVLVAGLSNGQVSWWDCRQGSRPVESTALSVSHGQMVTAVTWLAHKTRSELFSVSTDGQVLWWDTRKLNQPTDQLVLEPPLNSSQEKGAGGSTPSGTTCPPLSSPRPLLAATCLEYESTMPTKLMVATEQGKVVACNRRARSPADRISLIYNAHIAPIYAIQRNPFYLKNFLTVGDWTVKLWAEDFKESPILWTRPAPALLRGGCWSASRSSVLFTARLDGALDAWDLLTSWAAPAATCQVVDEGLEVVLCHIGGRLLGVGSQKGTLSLLHLPPRLVHPSDKHEKAAFTAILERETRRERVLEARHKEQRLRERVKGGAGRGGGGGGEGGGGGGPPQGSSIGGGGAGGGAAEVETPVNVIKDAEDEYYRQVAELKAQIEREEEEQRRQEGREVEEEEGGESTVAVQVTQAPDDNNTTTSNENNNSNTNNTNQIQVEEAGGESEEPKSYSSSGSGER